VLRKIFRPTREEVGGELRILHEEFCDLYTSCNILRTVKSGKLC
jgi:hypothetical protein